MKIANRIAVKTFPRSTTQPVISSYSRQDESNLKADGRLNVKSVKLFADGALGSRGAALLEDYSDRPGWSGFLLTREEIWEPLIRKWYREVRGFDFNLKCLLILEPGMASGMKSCIRPCLPADT